ncbi:MAG: endonuclease MutS2 [Ruminococcaceae bacterium]|nr:endonuclease MutS2 [Oscillospiraceae bacterium]
MSEFRKAIKTLEFDKITSLLADCAATEGAKLMAKQLSPEADIVRVKRRQGETAAAKYLIMKKTLPSFGAVKDVSGSIERAAKKSTLTPGELLDIASVLRTSRTLRDYIDTDPADETVLDIVFKRLTPNRFLEEKIFRAIPVEDFIADEASPALADIRRKIRHAQSNVRETLQKYVSGSFAKYLQESIVTVRNGRYVVPVKSEYKNEIKGLVHDTSSTGATVFIEPYGVVEANNELRELESKETREKERILASLSADCAMYGETINLNYYNITLLAFNFAKAEFSLRYNCSEPTINEEKFFSIEKARHPLLPQESVVPITVALGGEYDTLVITGPNTGGKTVSLKTVGLFALMNQAGLQLPCERADVCLFDEILADIGDEQSIEQSLSTFSSHMTNIRDILQKVSRESLVLFDELGSGTDPVEGAAIAISILEEIRSYGALCAATTHYAELKEYAVNKEGVMNAGCEFDIETLRPTYRLIIGTPGRSNAFAISERIGISKKIIERAEKFVSSENRRVEDVIAGLDRQRVELEKQRAEFEKERATFLLYEKDKKKYLDDLSERTHRDTQNLREQAARMMESAKASSNFIFDKLEKLQKQNAKELTKAGLEQARSEIRDSIKYSESSFVSGRKSDSENYKPPRPYKAGDEVIIVSVGKRGIILKAPDKDGNVTVRAGIITTQTTVDNLRMADEKKSSDGKKTIKGAVSKSVSTSSFKSEVDLRGMTGDEAWFVVDKYIDTAYLAGVYSVTLIHGKGTGALRTALWNALKREPRVASFRAGAYGEGDYGVTVVEIKH